MTAPSAVEVRDVRQVDGVTINPYWLVVRDLPGDEFFMGLYGVWSPEAHHSQPELLRRNDLVRDYCWTITDPATLAFVAEHAGPAVVDIGAGTGYWAYQLVQLGVDVVAYDLAPPASSGNKWHSTGEQWFPVKVGGPKAARRHPDRTLLLSWPPYDEPMGADTLRAYRGSRVVYIGEGEGGCTGDDKFHDLLTDGWTQVAEHEPVQWSGLHDRVFVYDRNTP